MPESAKKAEGRKGYQEQTESLRRGERKKSGRLVGAAEKCDSCFYNCSNLALRGGSSGSRSLTDFDLAINCGRLIIILAQPFPILPFDIK